MNEWTQECSHSECWNASFVVWEAVPLVNVPAPAAALFLCAAVRRCCPNRVLLPVLPLPNVIDAPWWRDCAGWWAGWVCWRWVSGCCKYCIVPRICDDSYTFNIHHLSTKYTFAFLFNWPVVCGCLLGCFMKFGWSTPPYTKNLSKQSP